MYAAETGQKLDLSVLLGLLLPLALLGGFAGIYLRERRLHPELDAGDEDDQETLMSRTVLKYGCLFAVVATLAVLAVGLLQFVTRPDR